MILFVQPFGLGSPGGGSRILRALLKDAPLPWLSIAATAIPAAPTPFGQEVQIKQRPYLWRMERTRFARFARYLDWGAVGRLEKELSLLLNHYKVRGVHAIAHQGYETVAAYNIAKKNQLPFFLTVHDDPDYCLKDHPLKHHFLPKLPECWRGAAARFVISEEMGQELCRRWGQKDYLLVTDGVEKIAFAPRTAAPNRLSVYFMGLLHISYEPNFVSLQKALQIVSQQQPNLEVSLTIRGASLRREAVVNSKLLRILPYGNENEVELDLENADVVYQPLSLDASHRAMNAYSLSTKMITYLGSGLPILFHGPVDSAAGILLAKNKAAFVCGSNKDNLLAQTLVRSISTERDLVISSALKLARKQFQLHEARSRFWIPITERHRI